MEAACPLCANSGHFREPSCAKKRNRLAAVSPKSELQLLLPFGLNYGRFTLADRSFAFADTTSKAEG
jgi:hypothetical protein